MNERTVERSENRKKQELKVKFFICVQNIHTNECVRSMTRCARAMTVPMEVETSTGIAPSIGLALSHSRPHVFALLIRLNKKPNILSLSREIVCGIYLYYSKSLVGSRCCCWFFLLILIFYSKIHKIKLVRGALCVYSVCTLGNNCCRSSFTFTTIFV